MTMRPLFEKVPHEGRAAWYMYMRTETSFPFYWHYHPEYELTLIVDSTGQRLVGEGIADYAPGDLVLLGPDLPHGYRSGAGLPRLHQALVIQFHRDFLGESFFDLLEMAPVARLLERSSCGLDFTRTAAGKRVAPALTSLLSQSPSTQLVNLLSVLNELASEQDALALSSSRQRPSYKKEYQNRIDAVCAYLEENSTEEIDYTAVSRIAHMDQASLCRFFKRATGRTMTAYVNELRIASAAHLLMETELSVLEVGCRVGFANHSNFNRQFRRLKKISPGELRKQFQGQSHGEQTNGGSIFSPLYTDLRGSPMRAPRTAGSGW